MTNPLTSVLDARTEPPAADALEKRLDAIRPHNRHAEAWLLGWLISAAPAAVADAIDAYERIGVRS